MPLPNVKRIIHCDWGARNAKRATCRADRKVAGWTIETIECAGDTATLLSRCRDGLNDSDCVVVGFDFPIGYPRKFAERAGLGGFLDALKVFGEGRWSSFFQKAKYKEEISITRPFYPRCCPTKGFAMQANLTSGLALLWGELFRLCERETSYRTAASPLFWTLGAKQVGTAAMCGWQEILQPVINNPADSFGIWPFEGDLVSMTSKYCGVIVETYPSEAYSHLGFPTFWSGKTSQRRRRERAEDIFNWAQNANVKLNDPIRLLVKDGFGAEKSGEDPFDALIGACSMIDIVDGRRSEGPCHESEGWIHEGWIVGQQ